MAGFLEPDVKQWFPRSGVNTLLSAQGQTTSDVTRTMVAAYKQRDHIAFLLKLVDSKKIKLSDVEQEQIGKIRKAHERYLIEGK